MNVKQVIVLSVMLISVYAVSAQAVVKKNPVSLVDVSKIEKKHVIAKQKVLLSIAKDQELRQNITLKLSETTSTQAPTSSRAKYPNVIYISKDQLITRSKAITNPNQILETARQKSKEH